MPVRVFKGKTVLITGGASGIGLAMANEFASAGANVVIVDMDKEALELRQKEFHRRNFPLLAVECNVTDEAACQTVVDEAVKRFGSIDLLFNNAGITQRSLFEKTEVKVIQKVMAVNFFGSVNITKAALPHLIDSQGVIIANESVAGVSPLLGRCGYAASKHAMHGFFTTLRCELRHKGVHVMIVCPGFIKTNLQTRALGGDGFVATHEQSRVGKQQTPEYVARHIRKSAAKEKQMLVFTFFGKVGYLVSRLFPSLYERLMTRQFASELKK